MWKPSISNTLSQNQVCPFINQVLKFVSKFLLWFSLKIICSIIRLTLGCVRASNNWPLLGSGVKFPLSLLHHDHLRRCDVHLRGTHFSCLPLPLLALYSRIIRRQQHLFNKQTNLYSNLQNNCLLSWILYTHYFESYTRPRFESQGGQRTNSAFIRFIQLMAWLILPHRQLDHLVNLLIPINSRKYAAAYYQNSEEVPWHLVPEKI